VPPIPSAQGPQKPFHTKAGHVQSAIAAGHGASGIQPASRQPAAHLQAAHRGVQANLARGGPPPPAPHLQAACRQVQTRSVPGYAPRPLAPHVQAAVGGVQAKPAPCCGNRPPAPHVQAAMRGTRPELGASGKRLSPPIGPAARGTVQQHPGVQPPLPRVREFVVQRATSGEVKTEAKSSVKVLKEMVSNIEKIRDEIGEGANLSDSRFPDPSGDDPGYHSDSFITKLQTDRAVLSGYLLELRSAIRHVEDGKQVRWGGEGDLTIYDPEARRKSGEQLKSISSIRAQRVYEQYGASRLQQVLGEEATLKGTLSVSTLELRDTNELSALFRSSLTKDQMATLLGKVLANVSQKPLKTYGLPHLTRVVLDWDQEALDEDAMVSEFTFGTSPTHTHLYRESIGLQTPGGTRSTRLIQSPTPLSPVRLDIGVRRALKFEAENERNDDEGEEEED